MFPSENGLKVRKGAMEKFMTENPFFNDKSLSEDHGNGYYVTPESSFGKRSFFKILELDDPIDSSNITKEHHLQIAKIL